MKSKYKPKGLKNKIRKIYYQIRIIGFALKWCHNVHLGDTVIYRGKKHMVHNGVRANSWRLGNLDNGDEGWVERKDCKKVKSFKNYYGSYKSGVSFYTQSWLQIWVMNGIEPWCKSCNIW